MRNGRAFVGTSGWVYPHWRGAFYPQKLSQRKWFAHYAERFSTVEINNTFYRLPSESVFRGWEERAPDGFVYALKANRYITHVRRLRDAAGPLGLFLGRARLLGEHLGPVLYQLPPRMKKDAARLEAFVSLLPDDVTHAFEFRDPSWYAEDVFDILKGAGCGLCVHDLASAPAPRRADSMFAYCRFHGSRLSGDAPYGPRALVPWAEWMARLLGEGREVYAYFNNDEGANAVKDALALHGMLPPAEGFKRRVA
jgi:uncharacterized protein YecE (DUF72 family)